MIAKPRKSTAKGGKSDRIAGLAGSLASGLNMKAAVAAANVWREQYNPLRGLDIQRAVSLLEDGERGAMADLQWTYRHIEMQDATLGAVIDRRVSAIEEMAWNILVAESASSPEELALAEKQRDALQAAYDGIANLDDAIEELCMASFRGYAHLEIVENADRDITELFPVPQWHWCRPGMHADWQLNVEARSGARTGTPVDMRRFISREVKRPINRVALIAFIRKSLSQKDWDAFIEVFGVPAIFLILPPELGEQERAAFQEVAEQIVSDARGVLPGNSKIETIESGARGVNPFDQHIKAQDAAIVLRGTGGKLTMLTESGSGTLAGGAHADTFEQIAKAEARRISRIFREGIDRRILDRLFPGQPHHAYFEIAANEETDTSAIVKDVHALATAGFTVEGKWLQEKTGYKLKAEGGGLMPAGQGLIKPETGDLKPEIMNREVSHEGTKAQSGDDNLLSAAAEMLAVARVADTSDLAGDLRMILAIDDQEEMTTALQEWRDALPDALGKTGEMDAAWEKILASAFAQGLDK